MYELAVDPNFVGALVGPVGTAAVGAVVGAVVMHTFESKFLAMSPP